MKEPPNKHWTIGFIDDYWESEWMSGYRQLDSDSKRLVKGKLDEFTTHEEPWREYEGVNCPASNSRTYIFNIPLNGSRNRAIQMIVRFDVENRMLTPVNCELV